MRFRVGIGVFSEVGQNVGSLCVHGRGRDLDSGRGAKMILGHVEAR